MKHFIRLIFASSILMVNSTFASDLVFDNMQVVPAIKINTNKFLSCKKNFSLRTENSGRSVPDEYIEQGYFCLNEKDNPEKVTYFTAQQLAHEYVGNVEVVGVTEHKMENKRGQYTVENVYVDLYYKNK